MCFVFAEDELNRAGGGNECEHGNCVFALGLGGDGGNRQHVFGGVGNGDVCAVAAPRPRLAHYLAPWPCPPCLYSGILR